MALSGIVAQTSAPGVSKKEKKQWAKRLKKQSKKENSEVKTTYLEWLAEMLNEKEIKR